MRTVLLLVFTTCLYVSSYSQKRETIYMNPSDSAADFYIAVQPTKSLTGYMFLIPGMFQKPDEVLKQTNLAYETARQGILTIIPVFKTGIRSLGVDTVTQASILEMLSDVRGRYRLANQKFYIGGFSIGGTCALKYAELAIRNNYAIKPTAVFAIDSPLDFERMYNSILRELRFPNTAAEIKAENEYMLDRFRTDFGGTPVDALANYRLHSVYSFSDTTQQAIKPLNSLPIRLYTEPDVNWWINDGLDYSGMNAFDFAAMTNELKRMGNTKVELITTYNKGYRQPDKKRHPHSWSIVEPGDLVKWLVAQK